MTRKYLIDGVAQADSSVLIKGRAEGLDSAADGSSATATAIIRDPTGVLSFTPWMEFAVEEDACSRARGWTGYLVNETISRGGYAIGVATGSPREWSFELFDLNSLLHRQVFHLASAKRPRESGSARMAWLLASEALSGVVFDNGKVQANPWMFDAADYRGKYADDVLADISVSSIDTELGELSFVYWDETAAAGQERSLFYHGPTATTSTSTISLSNVDADVNNTTCFWVHPDPTLERQGEDIYCGVYFTTRNGSIYRHSATTHAAYFAGKPHRDGTFSTDRISLGATAETHATRWLANHAGTIDTLKLTARLTPAVVNLLDAGMRVSVRLPHLPGFATATYLRVRRRTLPIEEGKRLWYDVPLELSLKGIPFAGGGNPGGFPKPPSQVSYVQEKGRVGDQVALDFAPTDGHLLTWFVASRTTDVTVSAPSGWTMLTSVKNLRTFTRYGAVYYRIASGDGATISGLAGTSGLVMHVFEWGDGVSIDTAVGTFGSIASQAGVGALAVSVTPSAVSTVVENAVIYDTDYEGLTYTAHAGVTQIYNDGLLGFAPFAWVGIKADQSGPSAVQLDFLTGTNGWGGISYAVHADASTDPPKSGQWVGIDPPEIVTMTGASGTTAFPFATGSLSVFVDNLDETPSITSQNGATGAFTLGFTPKAGEVVTVRYQGL